jgi:hypothetical protein
MSSNSSRKIVAAVLAACAAVAAPLAQAQDEAARTEAARAIAASLMGGLAGKLQEAIKTGGPAAAIGVCTTLAPTTTGALSRQRGMKVTRVSLKVRNPLLGTPDAWEQGVLAAFESRLAKGEAPDRLEFAETVAEPGGRYFRYVKALPVQPLCLNCHGDPAGFAPEVREALAREYPADRATGYAVGQVRGAISIKQPQ